jgi:hypothetical protein
MIIIESPEVSRLVSQMPATLVVSQDRISEQWLGRASIALNGVSVLTGRNLAVISHVVAKSLHGGNLSQSCRTLDPIGLTAPASRIISTVDDVRKRVLGSGVLLANAHGRECLLHLEDGVICGHSQITSSGTGDPNLTGLTSCLQGEGCYRLNYQFEDPQLIPARDLDVGIVFTNSCLAQKVGNGQFPSATTLTLSLLEGMAVAVVGSPGLREGVPQAGSLFRAALFNGASLDEATRTVNDVIRRTPNGMGTFVVFGDGALQPFPLARSDVHEVIGDKDSCDVTTKGTIVHGMNAQWTIEGEAHGTDRGDGTILVTPFGDDSTRVKLSRSEQNPIDVLRIQANNIKALSRLWVHELDYKGVDLGALRGSTVGAFRSIDGDLAHVSLREKMASTEEVLRAADLSIAKELSRLTVTTRFHFLDTYLADSSRMAIFAATCPECGDDVEKITWRHNVEAYERSLVACVLCGEVQDDSVESPVVCRLEGTHHVSRGEWLTQTLILRNTTDHDLQVAVAFGLLYQDLYGSDWDTVLSVSVAANKETVLRVGGQVPSDFSIADRHGLRAFCVAQGHISTYSRYLWVSDGLKM